MSAVLERLNAWFAPDQAADERVQLVRLVRRGFLIIGTGLGLLALWSGLAPITGAVIATGFVKVDMNRKVVQHQEGGIIKDILVREGEHVKQGQVLVTLDDVRVDASVDQLKIQLDGERAKNARLQAEATFAPHLRFPSDIEARESGPHADPKLTELTRRERELFRARREALDTLISVLRKQITETRSEIAALTDQLAAEEKGLKLQQEELKANEDLLKQGYVANTRVLTLRRAVADYESRYGEHKADLSRSYQKVSDLELRILSARNDYMKAAADELKDSTSRVYDLQERLRPSLDAAVRQKIVAPVEGEIVNQKVFTPGAVIGPRETIMEIVPKEKTLIVEAHLKPEDINYVRPGTDADVRLIPYKRRTTPLVEGTVSYVSGDRIADPQNPNNAWYVVYVEVPPEALAEAGNLKLLAGMPVEVYMRTDRRTTIDYLLAPVTDYFRRGMREPL